MKNFNITVDDIKRAENIYGISTPLLKGNLKRKKRTNIPRSWGYICPCQLKIDTGIWTCSWKFSLWTKWFSGCKKQARSILSVTKLTSSNARQIVNALEADKITHE